MFVIPTGDTALLVIPTGAKRGGGIPWRNLFVRRRDSSVRAGLVVSLGMTDTLKRFCRILLRKFCGVGIRITRFQKYSGISSPYHLGHARDGVLPFDRANQIAAVTIFDQHAVTKPNNRSDDISGADAANVTPF